MKKICVYCNEREPSEKDHVPPKSFFPKPRPSHLLTVPVCKTCHDKFDFIDENARNILASLRVSEENVPEEIFSATEKSLNRPGFPGARNFIKSIATLGNELAPNGIFLGKRPALNLDNASLNVFFQRIAQGLLYVETKVILHNCFSKWSFSFDNEVFTKLPIEMKAFLLSRPIKFIDQNIFSYRGCFLPGHNRSIWFLRFFKGCVFMVQINDKPFLS